MVAKCCSYHVRYSCGCLQVICVIEISFFEATRPFRTFSPYGSSCLSRWQPRLHLRALLQPNRRVFFNSMKVARRSKPMRLPTRLVLDLLPVAEVDEFAIFLILFGLDFRYRVCGEPVTEVSESQMLIALPLSWNLITTSFCCITETESDLNVSQLDRVDLHRRERLGVYVPAWSTIPFRCQ